MNATRCGISAPLFKVDASHRTKARDSRCSPAASGEPHNLSRASLSGRKRAAMRIAELKATAPVQLHHSNASSRSPWTPRLCEADCLCQPARPGLGPPRAPPAMERMDVAARVLHHVALGLQQCWRQRPRYDRQACGPLPGISLLKSKGSSQGWWHRLRLHQHPPLDGFWGQMQHAQDTDMKPPGTPSSEVQHAAHSVESDTISARMPTPEGKGKAS